jgi:hypothetical protein
MLQDVGDEECTILILLGDGAVVVSFGFIEKISHILGGAGWRNGYNGGVNSQWNPSNSLHPA